LPLFFHDFPWGQWVAGLCDLAWLPLLFHSFYIISVGMWCKELGTATIAFSCFLHDCHWTSKYINFQNLCDFHGGLMYGFGHPLPLVFML
jgi:hypothetical protein